MLNLQVFVLTLMPLLSGAVPGDGRMPIGALSFLGMGEPIAAEFMVGTWRCTDEFFRWGVTDKERAEVKPTRGRGFMQLDKDGIMAMFNLFRPTEGRWEMSDEGIALYDPRYPERVAQILPVRKRDNDRIWVLLPFAGGASGIGMVRVSSDELTKARSDSADLLKKPRKQQRSWDDSAE